MKFDPDTPGVFPSRVYDAYNHEIHWVMEGDTETGWCRIQIRDSEGGIYFYKGDTINDVWVRFAAPLRLEPINPRIETLTSEALDTTMSPSASVTVEDDNGREPIASRPQQLRAFREPEPAEGSRGDERGEDAGSDLRW